MPSDEIQRSVLPPFPALRAFYAAARHDRFRDAAASLGVTESAISHQVRKLEDFLHLALFEREGARLVLTQAGRRYFEAIRPAFEAIETATRDILQPDARQRVALTLPPSLAILWLIPRLSELEAAVPGVDLQLVATARVCNLRREQIDLAIRHGRGSWPDADASYLMPEALVPVCAPGLLTEATRAEPGRLLNEVKVLVNRHHSEEWTEWTAAHGYAEPCMRGAVGLDGQEQILEAAERGLGLAMGRTPLVDDRLRSGRLVAPFGLPDPEESSYYLCKAKDVQPTAPVRAVMRWLTAIAEEKSVTD